MQNVIRIEISNFLAEAQNRGVFDEPDGSIHAYIPEDSIRSTFGWVYYWASSTTGSGGTLGTQQRLRMGSEAVRRVLVADLALMIGTTMFFIIVTAALSVFIVLANRRRGLSPREIAAVTGGFILIMVATALVEGSDVTMVVLAALGGAVAQWGVDAHRGRQNARSAL
jgi:uncharacterized YccA/Bax inhibitor family protein